MNLDICFFSETNAGGSMWIPHFWKGTSSMAVFFGNFLKSPSGDEDRSVDAALPSASAEPEPIVRGTH
jgi:hypothetical protein